MGDMMPSGELLPFMLFVVVDRSGFVLLLLVMTDMRWFDSGHGNHAPSSKQLIRCFFKNSYDCLDNRVRRLLNFIIEIQHTAYNKRNKLT